MIKYSIVVPIYNVEKYLEKCLDSIKNQTYQNFEVIMVNDGSTDNSNKIMKKFELDNRFKSYYKENGGLSDARNFGIIKAKGDYLILIDGDDYIEDDLLFQINKELQGKKYDIIRFGLNIVNRKGNIIREVQSIKYHGNNLNVAIQKIITSEYVEPAVLYAYNLQFWKNNNFKYQINRIHEDYGLTPYILSKAKEISFLDYAGYNYVNRENSIMNQIEYSKIIKRVNDFKEQYICLIKKIKPNSKKNKLIISFISEALIYKARELNDQDRPEMIEFIKKEKVIDKIYALNIKKFLQKQYLKLNLDKRLKKLNRQFNQIGG